MDQKAAFWIFLTDTPLKRAQEVLTDLVSCARIGPVTRASVPALLMAETIHREIESLDAARWGATVVTNKLLEARRARVRSKYHLSARTGHHTLSSDTAEWEEIIGRKISI